MLWVYDHYSSSAGIDYERQNLTFIRQILTFNVDPRVHRVNYLPVCMLTIQTVYFHNLHRPRVYSMERLICRMGLTPRKLCHASETWIVVTTVPQHTSSTAMLTLLRKAASKAATGYFSSRQSLPFGVADSNQTWVVVMKATPQSLLTISHFSK